MSADDSTLTAMPTTLKLCSRFWAVTTISSSLVSDESANAHGESHGRIAARETKYRRGIIICISPFVVLRDDVMPWSSFPAIGKFRETISGEGLAARRRVRELTVRQTRLDQRIGNVYGERDGVDDLNVQAGRQQGLPDGAGAAEESRATKHDDIGVILLHGRDGFARERGVESG